MGALKMHDLKLQDLKMQDIECRQAHTFCVAENVKQLEQLNGDKPNAINVGNSSRCCQ